MIAHSVTAVKVPVDFEHGALTVVVSAAASGDLTGIQLAPAAAAEPIAPWEAPSYVEADHFDEEEVSLGSGPLAVPGTLSVPRSGGPSPAVVLLPGSGPNDRDETIGRNKPFKDLAWGLARRGIAVLRFDKVTFSHPAGVRGMPNFTVVDEYAPAALAAIELLRQGPAIDALRIFLLGPSLGGTVAPRIASSAPSVAGLVLLAAGSAPLHWSAVRQLRYLASLDEATAAASEPAIKQMSERDAWTARTPRPRRTDVRKCTRWWSPVPRAGSSTIAMTVAQTTGMILAALIVPKAASLIGKKTVYLAAGALCVAASIGIALSPATVPPLGIACFGVLGLGTGAIIIVLYAFVADTVDYGEWNSGVRAEGLNYAIFSFTSKVGLGVGGVIAAYTISIGGYTASAPFQTHSALQSIRIAAGGLPAALILIATATMVAYPLTEKAFRALIADIAQRRAAAMLDVK